MSKYWVGVLFCEDIRIERSGQETIVGVLSDTLIIEGVPGVLPRIGIYIRSRFDVNYKLNSLSFFLLDDGGEKKVSIDVGKEIIEKSFSEAAEGKQAFAGFKSVVLVGSIPIEREGRLRLYCSINGTESLCAELGLKLQKEV